MKKIIVCLVSMLFFACTLLNTETESETETGYTVQTVIGDNFTISWDTDTLYDDTVYADNISTYKIYYRTHDTTNWTLLDEIDSEDDIQYTITSETLAYGDYDLGVSSVNTQGTESDIHSSLDTTADPETGWYISWTA